MLWLYRFLVALIYPLARHKLRLLAKACSPKTQALEATRLGHFANRSATTTHPDFWIHGASVGEINMLQPLIEYHINQNLQVMVTAFTPSGLDRIIELFDQQVAYAFLPIDRRGAVQRWLDHIQPKRLIIAETELWPELYHQAHQRALPIFLVNARLSEKRMRHYQRLKHLYRYAIEGITLAACQSSQEAKRWQQLGLTEHQTVVTGNLKARLPNAKPPRPEHHRTDFIWTAGSVHPKEDQIILSCHLELLKAHPKAKLIIAPRHLKNLAALTAKLEALKLTWMPFQPHHPPQDNDQVSVYVVETFGQLVSAYAISDVAFVGGSLVDVGGHNLYEPASLGLPVLTGPHLDQQEAARDALQTAGGLVIALDAQALTEALRGLANNPSLGLKMGQAAHAVVEQEGLALERTLEAIASH